MSGFEYNSESGELLISSEYKTILVSNELNLQQNSGELAGTFILSGVTGRNNSLYGLSKPGTSELFECDPTKTYWVRLPQGGAITRIYDNLGVNYGVGKYYVYEGTNRFLNHSSGYLDCMDASGQLTWSAVSAGKVPKIQGIASFARAGVIAVAGGASQVIVGEPYFMINSLTGFAEYSGEGAAETYGVAIFRDGNTYYCFSSYFRPGGSGQTPAYMLPETISVPYAFI